MGSYPKYVIVDRGGSPHVRILAAYEKHSIVLPARILGAGFFHISINVNTEKPCVICFGESTSLRVKSREIQDAILIERFLGLGG